MFEKFTAASRGALVDAQALAYRRGAPSEITPLDLYEALSLADGIAGQVIAELGGTTPDPIGEMTSGQMPFTPEAKKALELSLREALSLGHNHIGTEHLLLALTRIENSPVPWPADTVRNAVIKKLMRQPSPKHLVAWPQALTREVTALLEAMNRLANLLEQDAIPVLDLRAALVEVDDAVTVTNDALKAMVLPSLGGESVAAS